MRTLPRYAAPLLALITLAIASPPAHAARPAGGPEQAATTAAARLLADFHAPAAAMRVMSPPAASLAEPPQRPAGPDLATRSAFWLVAAPPEDVMAWVQTHRPAGLTSSGGGQVIEQQPAVLSFAEFSAPPVPEVLVQRTLLVSVAPVGMSLGAEITGIRVDAQVTWMPPKPAGERIPASASEITLSLFNGSGMGSVRTEQITDPATVSRIKVIVDGLPLMPPGLTNCPADLGRQAEFVFTAGTGGPALASVVAQLGGCGTATVTIGNRAYPALWHASRLTDTVLGPAPQSRRLKH